MSELVVKGVRKTYGSLVALDDFSATFRPGEIHAILGENGAGKSTLVSILSGFVTPDQGGVSLGSRDLPLGQPTRVRQLGVSMVHQHFALVPAMTVEENFALDRLWSSKGLLNLSELAGPALELAERLDWAVEPKARVADLPVGVRQRVEILKALVGNAPVIILDEPTAVLSAEEVEDLFRVLRSLRDEGKVVLLIAHKLDEVLSVADRFTVLRRGKWITTADRGDVTKEQLVQWMIGDQLNIEPAGRKLGENVVCALRKVKANDETGVLRLTVDDLEVRAGEIFGIGGVDGNGQKELAEVLVGITAPVAGTREGDPSVAYIPQDRQREGLVLDLSIVDNISFERTSLVGFAIDNPKARRRLATELIERYSIKVSEAEGPVKSLSGGNQQKVVVARELNTKRDLIVAVNPTRGLDFRAAAFVHSSLLAAREAGSAVVLITADLDELRELSDRVGFLSGGGLKLGGDASAMLEGH
ncbi:MAG: ATP-binding cassette domain-containing protein [Armatimonadetes bacterium]|nr:ATP-binding cassette domain-containing protein [Armatimonadota bacterium]